MRQIQKAKVLGAGVMGSQIAAHLANAGIPVLLLDIVPGDLGPDENRSNLAQTALRRLGEQRPAPLMHRDVGRLIAPGNVEDDLGRVDEVDWVLEAVMPLQQLSPEQARRLVVKHLVGRERSTRSRLKSQRRNRGPT